MRKLVNVGDKVTILLKGGNEFKGIVTKTMSGGDFRVYSNNLDMALNFNSSRYESIKIRESASVRPSKEREYEEILYRINELARQAWQIHGNCEEIRAIVGLSSGENI